MFFASGTKMLIWWIYPLKHCKFIHNYFTLTNKKIQYLKCHRAKRNSKKRFRDPMQCQLKKNNKINQCLIKKIIICTTDVLNI